MSVPRYNPETTGRMTSIPTISFVGAEAAENTMTELARSGYRLAQAGEEMRSAAEQKYMDSLEVDVTTNFAKIQAQHKDDPEGLKKNLGSYIDSVVANIPFAFDKSQMKNAMAKQAARAYATSVAALAGKEQTSARAEAKARNELLEQDIVDMGIPVSEADKELLSQRVAVYKAGIASQIKSGILAPSEGELKFREFEGKMKASMATSYVQQSENPARAFYDVMAGNTPHPELNKLTPAEKQKLLGQAQALTTMQQNVVSMSKEKTLTDNRDNRNLAMAALLADPTSIATAEGRANLDTIMNKTVSAEDVTEAAHMKDYMDHWGDKRYQQSDPNIYEAVEAAVAQRQISDSQLLQLHGQGLSTEDYVKLKNMKDSTNATMDSATFSDVQSQVDSMIKELKEPGILAQAKALIFGKANFDATQAELATKSFYKDLNEGWLDGTIPHTKQGIQEFFEQRKPGLLQAFGVGSNQKDKPIQDAGTKVLQQDVDLTTLADKYTSGKQLIDDMNKGVITREQAIKIDKLKGFSRQPQGGSNGR